jgi:hypothetical protein
MAKRPNQEDPPGMRHGGCAISMNIFGKSIPQLGIGEDQGGLPECR